MGAVLNAPVAPPAMESFVAESADSQPEEWDETVAEEWLINHPLYTIEGVRMNLDGNE